MKFLIAIFSEMLVSLLLANGAYVLRKAPELGHEVCIMGTKETNVKLRRKITSSREKVLSDCGFLTGPVIECEENIIKTVISYVPQTNTKRVNKTTCCPGWKDYNPSLGCFKPAPCLSLPEYTPSHCVARRREKLVRNRNNYRLRKPPKVPTGDPDDPVRVISRNFLYFR
ncbi:uncharacterized protein LOC114522653 [Dendronephthya gigantea]|uniref:uncharacterized protein LOC114522653 n=1 Tax=Dendronephthya gigantea TaxID=151771 RepID=UPI00106C1D60|nr:uncharacterized protein LOC114522653 [Dendronephthya gigantea]